MIMKKYVVADRGYTAVPKAVCDTFDDAVEVAQLIFGSDAEHYVHETLYIRSKQTVARDSLYEMQNGHDRVETTWCGGSVARADV